MRARLGLCSHEILEGLSATDLRGACGNALVAHPAGILHGGASVALAETLGSTGANLVVDRDKQLCVGLEINANHVRAMREGTVTGTARPLHLGGTTQVWEIRITDEKDRLVCVSRITMAVLDRSSMK